MLWFYSRAEVIEAMAATGISERSTSRTTQEYPLGLSSGLFGVFPSFSTVVFPMFDNLLKQGKQ